MKAAPEIGTRVRLHPMRPFAGRGVGAAGVVVAVRDVVSTVTGMVLRYVEVDVRLDSGALVTRSPAGMTSGVRS